ncbi:MAG: HlyC/CorC family transporter [Gammaproteobacteria bacterium]|nr:HlyC/CorC family transporter [Gammaproteobacteria bacterium]
MDNISLEMLVITLFGLFILSAFFSSSETSMMALNRYRLKHLANEGHRGAKLAEKLLDKPDQLLGLILFGNNLVNISAASVATVIGLKLYGEAGIAIATMVLTVLVLIFAEVAPKTIAALYPESIAFPAAYILTFLGKIFYPFVWLINLIANTLLSIFRINPENTDIAPLSREELRTVVQEAGHMIPIRHKKMLISILDLENSIVDDIMVPRNEIEGIDLNDNPDEIIEQIANCQHTRLLVYEDNIDEIKGVLHARKFPRILSTGEQLRTEDIVLLVDEPYFVPMGTPLHVQLRFFQKQKIRLGLVVDEYGDIQGIVTMEDILEEIVGEFTTDIQTYSQDINYQEDGSILIDGTAMLRDINRQLHWHLPLDGPKTLNGLILENLEHIPESGTSLKVGDYMLEILQSGENAVKMVKVEQLEPKLTELQT